MAWQGGGGGGGILDKLYVIIFPNYFEQLLLGYIAYFLIVNHLTVLPSAQAQSCGNGPRHPVNALVYSREYKKDFNVYYVTIAHCFLRICIVCIAHTQLANAV